MGTCLVKKFKRIVDNNNLPLFGMIRIDVRTSSAANRTINMEFDRDTTIKLSNGTFGNGQDTMTIAANTLTGVTTSNVNATMFVPKYGLKTLYNYNASADVYILHLQDLEYAGENENNINLTIFKASGDVSNIEGTYQNFIVYGDDAVSGDISNIVCSGKLDVSALTRISGKVNVTSTITEIKTTNSETILDLEDLEGSAIEQVLLNDNVVGNIVNIANAGLTRFVSYSKKVTGTLESVVEKLWASPISKRSGNVSLTFATTKANSVITFNGLNIDSVEVAFGAEVVTVSRASSTIGTYDGSTWTYA